jgi:XTP/dITP diphosphohydrolase
MMHGGNGGNDRDTEGGVQGGCSCSLTQEKTMAGKMIVATGNRNKMIEIREILSDVDVEIVSMKEAGIRVEIVENGRSFAENSAIKALTVAKASGEMAIADDSGLVIDCLRGEPGIWSARYMGEDTSYDLKNRTLISRVNDFCRGYEAAGGALAAMEGAEFLESWTPGEKQTPETLNDRPGADENGKPGRLRSARFVCACTCAWPDGTVKTIVGRMEGRIAYAPAGPHGFGYDPIFYLPQLGKTSAELLPEEKNAISHRGKAFTAMHDYLAAIL